MKKTIFITIFVLMLAIGLVSADLNVDPTNGEMKFDHLEQEKKVSFVLTNDYDFNITVEITIDDDGGLDNIIKSQIDISSENFNLSNQSDGNQKTIEISLNLDDITFQSNFEGFDGNVEFNINFQNETDLNENKTFTLNLEIPEYKKELKVSNTNLEFNDFNPGDSFEKSITLENSGTVTIDDFNYEIDESFKNKYNIEHTLVEKISPKASVSFKIEGTIPDDLEQDASDQSKLTITADGIDDIEIDIKISAKIMVIDRIEIRADGRRLERILREDYLSSSVPYRIREDAKLGDEIELIIYIKNNLPSDDRDNELRNIDIELYSFDIIDADGLEGYISRIRPGRTEDVTLSFYLDPRDLYAGDSPYDLEIRVSGEDWDRNLFEDTWFIDIDIETLTYNLLMHNIIKSPDPICAGERLRVEFDLFNIGTRDLDDAAITFRSTNLDINEFIQDIEIYDDERQFITKFLDIPSNSQEGDYTIQLTAYPRRTSTRDTSTQNIIISVRDCEEETTTTTIPTTTTTTTTVQETTTTTLRQIIGSDAGVIPAEPRRDNEQLYVILLIVLIGIVILAVGGMIGYLIKKK